ncbi:MAG TPA: hypothetical protein VN279_06485, partial [Rhodocyclaceae bacterium]|nr:hypothetical protein [Rhodocyclaceae bacterium]
RCAGFGDPAAAGGMAVLAWICGFAGVFWIFVAPVWLARRWGMGSGVTAGLLGWLVLIPPGLALVALRAWEPGEPHRSDEDPERAGESADPGQYRHSASRRGVAESRGTRREKQSDRGQPCVRQPQPPGISRQRAPFPGGGGQRQGHEGDPTGLRQQVERGDETAGQGERGGDPRLKHA